ASAGLGVQVGDLPCDRDAVFLQDHLVVQYAIGGEQQPKACTRENRERYGRKLEPDIRLYPAWNGLIEFGRNGSAAHEARVNPRRHLPLPKRSLTAFGMTRPAAVSLHFRHHLFGEELHLVEQL